jgi:hypothetical protein
VPGLLWQQRKKQPHHEGCGLRCKESAWLCIISEHEEERLCRVIYYCDVVVEETGAPHPRPWSGGGCIVASGGLGTSTAGYATSSLILSVLVVFLLEHFENFQRLGSVGIDTLHCQRFFHFHTLPDIDRVACPQYTCL